MLGGATCCRAWARRKSSTLAVFALVPEAQEWGLTAEEEYQTLFKAGGELQRQGEALQAGKPEATTH